MAKEKAKTSGKTNLLKIVDPLQKLLDQRVALDVEIAAMKKVLIAAIEDEEASVKSDKPKTKELSKKELARSREWNISPRISNNFYT